MSAKSGQRLGLSNAEADQTTDDILAAALASFGVDGFKATSLSAVAVKAGVSRPTLYARYPDKTHLFRAVLERGYDEAIGAAERTHQTGGAFADVLAQILLDYYGGLFDRFHDLPQVDELILLQSEHAHDIVAHARTRMQKLLTRLIKQYAERGGLSIVDTGLPVAQVVDLIRLAPLSFKPPGTSRSRYRTRLKNLAAVISLALDPDRSS